MGVKGIKNLIKKYNFFPSKKLGQNFLVSKKILQKIIEISNLSKDEIVLEVGPGIGNLTIEMAKKAKKIIAIEKDQRMIEILKEQLKNFDIKNVELKKGDILKEDLSKYKFSKVVANIPYYLTSPLVRKFLENNFLPKEIILMVQKEVAQRICQKPPKMNLLAVAVQFYADPQIEFFVPKKFFWPKPKVDSALIKIIPKKISFSPQFIEIFFKIVKAGFSQPRKKLINNLSEKLKIDKNIVKDWLFKNGIKENQRAQNLKIEDWINLTKTFELLIQ
jgi:16S rRNA (adenine1518-N6/adenine1519-N6)-dimethyltransferase